MSTETRAAPSDRRALLAMAVVVLFWGANFSVVKLALGELAPLPFTMLRFLLASAVLGGFLAARGERVRIARGHRWAVVGLGLVGTTLYQTLFIYGIDWTLAGNAALMLAACPVFTTLLSLAFRQEPGSVRVAAGVALSVVGIGLVVLGGQAGVRFGAGSLPGDLAVLASAAAWSIYTVGSAPLVRHYGVRPVTAATMWVGTAGLLLVSLPALLAQEWSAVSPAAWLAVGYSGAFAIGTAYTLWSYCVRQLGSTRTTLYANLTPLVALAVAWLTLGETPGLLQAAGAAAILTGAALVRRSRS